MIRQILSNGPIENCAMTKAKIKHLKKNHFRYAIRFVFFTGSSRVLPFVGIDRGPRNFSTSLRNDINHGF